MEVRLVRLLLVLLTIGCPALPVWGQQVLVERLDRDPPAREVLAGQHDAELRPGRGGSHVINEPGQRPVWWRVRVDRPIAAAVRPQLEVQSPYLNWLEAWVPGAPPSRHALYGAAAERNDSTRALVVPLPNGLTPGQAIWLRVHPKSVLSMPVAIVPLDEVHRRDIIHVAWRGAILGSITAMALLVASLWLRLRIAIYGCFTAYAVCILFYLAGFGGEARDLPWLGAVFGASPVPVRLAALFAGYFLIEYQRRYLDTARQTPRLDLALRCCAYALLILVPLNLVQLLRFPLILGNLVLAVGSLLMMGSCIWMALRRRRLTWILLAAWIPLLLFCVLRCLQLIGWIAIDGSWVAQGFSLALAISCLLATLGMAEQMMELQRDRDRASLLANMDSLTGALTRSAIKKRLEYEIERTQRLGEPLSIAFIDIDRFKRINDEYGHAAGDACLRHVVDRVRGRLRTLDALGRQGGDELLAILPGADLRAAAGIAEDIRYAVADASLRMGSGELRCTLSLGVAALLPGESFDALLQRADAALYVSKAEGRDRVSLAKGRDSSVEALA